jgi:hypothetical protein
MGEDPDALKVFSAVLECNSPKFQVEVRSDTTQMPALLEELNASARVPVKAFVVLFADGRVRVDSPASFADLLTKLRSKLQAARSRAETERAAALRRQQEDESISPGEADELKELCTIRVDIILVTSDGADDGAEEAYSADKLRAERRLKLSEADKENDGSGSGSVGAARPRQAPRDASSVVKLISLRFFADQDQNAKENGVEVVLPFKSSWREVCDTLHQRFQRIVHFRYIDDRNAWRDVRSDSAFTAFRAQVGEEGLEKGASLVVAQVQLLPFGSGPPPITEALRDSFSLADSCQTLEHRLKLISYILNDSPSADAQREVEEIRRIVQGPNGTQTLLHETDEVGRTALHLAAASGRLSFVQALLSGPQAQRARVVCARDSKGRTPLHGCKGDEVVIRLLQANANPLLLDNLGCSPLHTITDSDVAERLIKAKSYGAPHDAKPGLPDARGRTALACHASAPFQSNGQMLAWLGLQAPGLVHSDGSQVKVDLLALDCFGRSVLHDAAAANNWEALDVLLKAGPFDINQRDSFGLTPLHAAAKVNGLKSVALLLAKHANPDARDAGGRQPVEYVTKDSVAAVLAAAARSLQKK